MDVESKSQKAFDIGLENWKQRARRGERIWANDGTMKCDVSIFQVHKCTQMLHFFLFWFYLSFGLHVVSHTYTYKRSKKGVFYKRQTTTKQGYYFLLSNNNNRKLVCTFFFFAQTFFNVAKRKESSVQPLNQHVLFLGFIFTYIGVTFLNSL